MNFRFILKINSTEIEYLKDKEVLLMEVDMVYVKDDKSCECIAFHTVCWEITKIPSK